MQYEKILVIQTAFIGDVVLSTSLLETIHRDLPNAQIDCLVRKGNEGLLTGHPFLHEVLIWDKKAAKYRNWWKTFRLIRSRRYDVVINLQRFFSTGLLCGFSGAKKRIGFRENPASLLFTDRSDYGFDMHKQNVHETQRYFSLWQKFSSGGAEPMRLYPDVVSFERVKNYKLKKYVVMCPASVWFTKQLPREKWVSLIDQMPIAWDVYLLGGLGDLDLCEWIRNQTHNRSVRNLAGQFNFLESAALMRDAEMCYVNDSGPMHIAASVEAKITAFYLSTVPSFGFAPLLPTTRIAETKHDLDCRPCGVHGYQACPKGHFRCSEIEMQPWVPPTEEPKYQKTKLSE